MHHTATGFFACKSEKADVGDSFVLAHEHTALETMSEHCLGSTTGHDRQGLYLPAVQGSSPNGTIVNSGPQHPFGYCQCHSFVMIDIPPYVVLPITHSVRVKCPATSYKAPLYCQLHLTLFTAIESANTLQA